MRSSGAVLLVSLGSGCAQPAKTLCGEIVDDDVFMAATCPDLARLDRVDQSDCEQELGDACTPDEIELLIDQLYCDADPCTNNTQEEQDCLAALEPVLSVPCVDALHAL